MKSDGPLPLRGWIGRVVSRSGVYRSFQRPATPRPLLEGSWLLGRVRRGRWALWLGGLMGLTLTALGLLGGQGGLLFSAALLGFALARPGAALLTLPTLLLWGPRIDLGAMGGEAIFLRLDQVAVAGMALRGIAGGPLGFRSPPGQLPFVAFLSVVALSIAVGLFRGTLTAPMSALLYLVQWVDLYLIYVAAWSLGPRVHHWAAHAWALPIIALAVYGLAEYAWPYPEDAGIRYRTFERMYFPGQANHAAGLFALATATGLGLTLNPRLRTLGLALALLATLALPTTGSRSGVLAWVTGLGAFALIQWRPLRWWTPPLGVLGLAVLPASLWIRLSLPGSSMHDRLVAWKSALSTVHLYPILGLGAGARHRSYYDNHYLMTLAESGLAGLFLLVALLLGVARALGGRVGGPCAPWTAGALAGLTALGVHGLATATFVVTMTAGPFFWYAGMALAQQEEKS